jgi:single stranded DNA-binding protein
MELGHRVHRLANTRNASRRTALRDGRVRSTGERKEAVEWHRVIVWGKQGTNCSEMLTKGRQVYVEGRLRTHSYEKDGEKRYVTAIIAQRVQFLGPKPNGGVTDIDQALPADDETAPF